MVQQLRERGWEPDLVLSPVGGGGLMSGVATAVRGLAPECRVIGVEPEAYDDHVKSAAAGERVRIDPHSSTRCDSLMATQPGVLTWAVNSRLVDRFISVSEDEVAHAISFAFRYLKLVVEPGGAVGLAALLGGHIRPMPGATSCAVLSGGNIDAATFNDCLAQYPAP
jgi:threonine dehydratase